MSANPPSRSDSPNRRPGSAGEGADNPSAPQDLKHEEELQKEDIRKGKQKEEEEEEEEKEREAGDEEEGERESGGESVEKKDIPSESDSDELEEGEEEEDDDDDEASAPPLPDEAPPGQAQDDGWEPVWDVNAQAYYFYNRFTNVSQWENPRLPGATSTVPPGVDTIEESGAHERPPVLGGYNPAIHGDYDPTAPYAQQYEQQYHQDTPGAGAPNNSHVVAGSFNRFTGRWQPATLAPENYNDENKSQRQMRAFFDVDAAANSHNGRSLKAERSGKKLSKKELKAFKDKRREKKEEKRRAWLRD